MKTNYSITLSAKNADNTKSIIASLSDNEMTTIQEVNRANYSIEIHRIHSTYENAATFSEAIKWLKETKLTHTEYILNSVQSKVIHLPDGIFFKDGFLEVRTVDEYANHTPETCHKEIELMHWIATTFPKSKYAKYRNIFTLGVECEEYVGKMKLTKYIYTVSPSGNKDIIVSKNIYKKNTIEL